MLLEFLRPKKALTRDDFQMNNSMLRRIWRAARVAVISAWQARDEGGIRFTKSLRIRPPRTEFQLSYASASFVGSMLLSLPDAIQVFSLTKAACEANDIRTIEIGDAAWKIDARVSERTGIHI